LSLSIQALEAGKWGAGCSTERSAEVALTESGISLRADARDHFWSELSEAVKRSAI